MNVGVGKGIQYSRLRSKSHAINLVRQSIITTVCLLSLTESPGIPITPALRVPHAGHSAHNREATVNRQRHPRKVQTH